jgi:hypothetical protein
LTIPAFQHFSFLAFQHSGRENIRACLADLFGII